MPNPADNFALPFDRSFRARACADQHFGSWCIEPKWFKAKVDAIRAGTLKPIGFDADGLDDDEDDEGGDAQGPGYTIKDGVAIVCIDGQMTKRGSSFGGCSTIAVRRALRAAAADYAIRAIVLHICSPGGTTAGTADLADDVMAVREGKIPGAAVAKRVDAYIADLGCSAAYWVASQCESIIANKTAIVGSIGTMCLLEDDTGFNEKLGVSYRVVSTGPYKGLGADGKVDETLAADVQREVDEVNGPFLAAVSAGRGKKIPDIAAVSDGRAYVSEQALARGLIDRIASLDATIEDLAGSTNFRSNIMTATEQVRQIAAEHPESVASYVEQGKNAGVADAHRAEIGRMTAIEAACPGRPSLAISLFKAGKDADDAKIAVAELDREAAERKAESDKHAAEMAEAQKKIERLEFEANERKPIGTGGASKPQGGAGAGAKADDEELSVEQKAEMEFDADAKIRAEFKIAGRSDEEAKRAFVKYRVNSARGLTPTPRANRAA